MNENLLAQIRNPVLPEALGGGQNPDYTQGGAVVGKLLGGVIGAMFVFAFILAFFYLIIGGVSWITSAGDKAGMEAARNKIIHAILGLVIIGGAWAIMTLLARFFGIDLTAGTTLKLPIPSLTQ